MQINKRVPSFRINDFKVFKATPPPFRCFSAIYFFEAYLIGGYLKQRITPYMLRCTLGVFILSVLLNQTQTVLAKEQGIAENKPSLVFLSEVFKGDIPKTSTLWIKGKLKQKVTQILGHRYHKLRVKYWRKENRSVWILDEIGKEKPITTGIVINNGIIEKVEVLAFRESRGWEVKYPFFTQQFKGITLKTENDTRLNKHIDGITGATLSVNALSVQARMALYLHRHIVHKDSP